MSMPCRRLTRLTNARSKKKENHEYALAIYFCWYNFVRTHMSLKTDDGQKRTPAMVAGLTDHVWTMRELLEGMAP